jgi:hypothetical protein
MTTFLAGELAAQRDADREPLRPVGQVVQVDHCHLRLGGGDRPLTAVGQVAADDHGQRPYRRAQPAQQGVDAARYRAARHPRRPGGIVAQLILEQREQVAEAAQDLVVVRGHAADLDGPVSPGRDDIPAQPRRHLADQHRVLGALVLGVGEHERQQFLLAEFGERPVERADRPITGGHVRGAGRVVRARRREHPDIAERLGW